MRNGRFSISFGFVKYICSSAIGPDCNVSNLLFSGRVFLTSSIHRHVQISNWTICAKYFFEMVDIHILGEPFDDDLHKLVEAAQ